MTKLISTATNASEDDYTVLVCIKLNNTMKSYVTLKRYISALCSAVRQ